MDLFLTRGKVAVIDVADWDKVKGRRWHLHPSKHRGQTLYYARATINYKKVYLHRFIMDAQPHEEVDHLDGDGLNCRRGNLECVPPRVNKERARQRKATQGNARQRKATQGNARLRVTSTALVRPPQAQPAYLRSRNTDARHQ